jgi:hypothetical protein
MFPTCPSKLRQTAPRRRTSGQPPGSATNLKKGYYGLKTILSSPFQSDIPPPQYNLFFMCPFFRYFTPVHSVHIFTFSFRLILIIFPVFSHIHSCSLFSFTYFSSKRALSNIPPHPPRGDPILIYM